MQSFTIVGAGPAGLAAAYFLAKGGNRVTVVEQDDQVGGLSKTVVYQGFRFDIGGHRFFTKSDEVNKLWQDMLGQEFLRVPKLSRIRYHDKFFYYPLKPLNAMLNLGAWNSVGVIASFLKAKIHPRRPEVSLEDWVSNRFGDKLYRIFFKVYSEKVWGTPCSEISADWATQRIRNMSLAKAILNALGLVRGKKVTTLIDEFDFPRYGTGQMYEKMSEKAVALGAQVLLGRRAVAVGHGNGRVDRLTVLTKEGNSDLAVENLISSMPVTELAMMMDPPPPQNVLDAARKLRYRSILTVNFPVKQADIVPDTSIYIHDPEVRAGRLQFYKNWSPAMVPDQSWNSIEVEYFTFEGDDLWTMDDNKILELAKVDLAKLKLLDTNMLQDGLIVRYPKAYPIYDDGYQQHMTTVRSFLGAMSNLTCVGRYGQFRYNNMDHSIMTGILGARRLLGEDVDPWQVNAEAEYHEVDLQKIK